MMEKPPHLPVMLDDVIELLDPQEGLLYLDGTFGAGGYTRAFLEKVDCRVIGMDRDKNALEMAKDWKGGYGDRLTLLHGPFGDIKSRLEENKVDGFILDLGVSSMQLDQAKRGFSFRFEGPLDMRMDQSCGQSAADLVNNLPEGDLARLIRLYGEERHARRIARSIVEARAVNIFTSTAQLAETVRASMPYKGYEKIDPATRSFQALRIAVNDELGELERALQASEHILNEGGRLIVVTFHSLEDRIVKKFLKERSGNLAAPSRHMPVSPDEAGPPPTFQLFRRKARKPSREEISSNPRSRSARLRMGTRTSSPPWPESLSEEREAV